MSVKSPPGLVLYYYLNMLTINKTYLILSRILEIIVHDFVVLYTAYKQRQTKVYAMIP
jgi:hypothetical protein